MAPFLCAHSLNILLAGEPIAMSSHAIRFLISLSSVIWLLSVWSSLSSFCPPNNISNKSRANFLKHKLSFVILLTKLKIYVWTFKCQTRTHDLCRFAFVCSPRTILPSSKLHYYFYFYFFSSSSILFFFSFSHDFPLWNWQLFFPAAEQPGFYFNDLSKATRF